MAPIDNSTAPRSSMGFIHNVLSADVPAPRRMHTLELEERPMPPAGPASVVLKTAGSGSKTGSDPVGSMGAVLRACSLRPLAGDAAPSGEAALQPLGSAQERAVEFERLLTETIAPLVQCPQQEAAWMPSALVAPQPRVLHLEARIMHREPTRRPPEVDPLVQFVRSLAPAREAESPQGADGVTGYGRARLDAWVVHSANQVMARGDSRGVCRLPVPALDGKRPSVSDPLAFLLDGSLLLGSGRAPSNDRAELGFSAASLLPCTRGAKPPQPKPPQPKLMPELARAPRRQLPARLLERYAEHAADTAQNDAAYQLNLHYQEDIAMPSSLTGGEPDDAALSCDPNEDAMPGPATPDARGSSVPVVMERVASEDGLQTPTCKTVASKVVGASDASKTHGMWLDESLADAVDSFFVGGDGGDSKRADYGRGGSASEAEAPGLGDLLNKHALASSSLLALLPESAEEHVPLLAAQLVSRLVAAGSTSTILWLLPDALVPAAVSFWHALLAADRRCVHSYAARELTCVPATSDEPSFPQTGDSQQAFEPAFEPPLRSGEVSQRASDGRLRGATAHDTRPSDVQGVGPGCCSLRTLKPPHLCHPCCHPCCHLALPSPLCQRRRCCAFCSPGRLPLATAPTGAAAVSRKQGSIAGTSWIEASARGPHPDDRKRPRPRELLGGRQAGQSPRRARLWAARGRRQGLGAHVWCPRRTQARATRRDGP